jgi:dipeptidyl aminopeptidase/acylaminoacyl peptidase
MIMALRFVTRTFASALILVVAFSHAHAQQPAKFDFTIANIMRGPEVYGREPSNVRWTLDGKWIYFMWLEPGSDWRLAPKQFRVSAVPGAKPERVTGPLATTMFSESGELSPDGSMRLIASGSALLIADVKAGTTRALTQTLESKSGATWSTDGREVLYISAGNAFGVMVSTGGVRQLTDIRISGDTVAGGRGGRAGAGAGRAGTAGANNNSSNTSADSAKALDQKSALERQQRDLFQVIRDRAFQDSVARADGRGAGGRGAGGVGSIGSIGGVGGRGGRGVDGAAAGTDANSRGLNGAPVTFTLLPNERPGALSLAPSGRAALFPATIPAAQTTTGTIVPSWVTSTGYVEEINGRPKVGDAPAGTTRLLFMSLPSGQVTPLRLAGNADAALRVNMAVLGWNQSGTAAIVMSNSADFKSRWIYTVSDSGKATLIETLRDSAWIGGPCNRCAGWLDGGRRLYYVSEADGYAHLYAVNADGTDRKQLTSGKWEVTAIALSKDKRSFYLTSSEQSVFEQHFYRMPVEGGARVKITGAVGGHTVTLSPDESMIVDVYSRANRPPELFIGKSTPGAELSQLTTSPTAAWLSFPWIAPEIVMIPASDGKMVPAQIYRPAEMKGKANGAAVIFVHGAGYLHNVMNYWKGSYPREYLFNQYLASKGYVVLDIDYRGSAGYGRDWRTAIYRWMGGRDLQDQVDGVKYLKKNYGIDPERVGIYGGSYGGFITLMALFTEPKWFGAGAALRSVTDWAHYNHGYTGPILNLPENDTLSYRRSSPIYFADGLEDPLVMLHGMVDTNVEFQDIVRLTQRLIELGKHNWYLAPYPVEDHGFARPDSWTDEYTRIFNLFENTIRVGKKTLPGTP